MLSLLRAILVARRPDFLVVEERCIAVVERAEHPQHRRLAEAPRTREENHPRTRINEVLENQRLVHAIRITGKRGPVARPHNQLSSRKDSPPGAAYRNFVGTGPGDSETLKCPHN